MLHGAAPRCLGGRCRGVPEALGKGVGIPFPCNCSDGFGTLPAKLLFVFKALIPIMEMLKNHRSPPP